MLNILILCTLVTLLLLLLWQNVHLANQLQEHKIKASILGDHLAAERRRIDDLLNCNYELASLNEELFVAIDQHSRPLAKLLGYVAHTN